MGLPQQVTLIEVGPRDGLQNEPKTLTTDIKLELIERLVRAGLSCIEATSFVSPKWVPQMADHKQLVKQLKPHAGVTYPILIPNRQGMETAIELGIKHIAVFTAASNTFSQKNTNCSLSESLLRTEEVVALAQQHHIRARGYISCVLGCPYEGKVPLEKVKSIATQLVQWGCEEVSLGDTIGVGTPAKAQELLEYVANDISLDQIALHFHDTYGQALANIYACLLLGAHRFDSSVAGLGGCPYAPGASGNVATEDVVYMLQGLGIETGIDLKQLIDAGYFISKIIGRPTRSRVASATRHQSV